MDRDGTLFKTPSLDNKLRDMSLVDFEEYAGKTSCSIPVLMYLAVSLYLNLVEIWDLERILI